MSAAVPPHKKIPIIREVYMDLNDKKVKTIQVIPSNKYYSILETDMDDEKYYTYRIIDAVGVVVYENLDTIVGGFNTQVESIGCGMEFPEILMGNLRDILFAEDVEKFILYDEMMFDMSREGSIRGMIREFSRTDIFVTDDAQLILDEVK